MKNFTLREVFNAGGFPAVTYVERKHLGLEDELRRAVDKGFAIIAVTGPSKSGKTVLCHSVIAETASIKIDGGQIKDINSLWLQIITKSEVPLSQIVQSTTTSTITKTGSLGVNAQIASGSMMRGEADASSTANSANFGGDHQTIALDALKSKKSALIIDDFHYIEKDLRRAIIRALKPEIFAGLTVIVISVPYKAFAVIDAESEMEGRFRHIEIQEWSPGDLLEISTKGQAALNISIAADISRDFTDEALGNPLLMQNFCFDACYGAGIRSTAQSKIDISDAISPTAVYVTTARDVGLPIFKRLAMGPQSRSQRIDRPFTNGAIGDTYEAILAAIAITGPTKEIHYDDLRQALRTVLSDKHPQKHEVTSAIKQMVEIAKEINSENPAIDFDQNTVFLQNPFFQFYLRWMHRPTFESTKKK